jgi:uncharacterized damage-inducible protein DinB
MQINQALLPEFDMEMAKTRKTLERVPEDNFGWKPHEKSMTMGRLTGHIAEIPMWGTLTINESNFDVAPIGAPPPRAFIAASRQEALDTFDKNVASARTAIEGASNERLMEPWSLLHGGAPMFTMPRIAVLRGFVMNHMIHHRAQLGVYLRLNDIPVPSIYGPSADEMGM